MDFASLTCPYVEHTVKLTKQLYAYVDSYCVYVRTLFRTATGRLPEPASSDAERMVLIYGGCHDTQTTTISLQSDMDDVSEGIVTIHLGEQDNYIHIQITLDEAIQIYSGLQELLGQAQDDLQSNTDDIRTLYLDSVGIKSSSDTEIECTTETLKETRRTQSYHA